MKKTKNAGFTLVELMIVVAIIGVLAGAYVASLSMNTAARLREETLMVDNMLARARVATMSGDDMQVVIRMDFATKDILVTLEEALPNGKYQKIDTQVLETTEKVTVRSERGGVAAEQDISYYGTGAVLRFRPGTGAFVATEGWGAGGHYTEFEFSSGAVDYRIELHPLTGYFETKT